MVPAAVERRIREYLVKRAASGSRVSAGEREVEARSAREAMRANTAFRVSDSILSLESLLPKAVEFDGKDPDALAYTELERYGYGDLVEPIMDAGGHLAVSQALGIAFAKPEPKQELVIGLPVPKIPDYGRGLMVGASLDEEIAAMLTRAAVIKAAPDDDPGVADREPSARARRLDLPTKRTRRSAVKASKAVVPTQWPTPLAPFSLNGPARIYAVIAALVLSAPVSKATTELAAILGSGDFDDLRLAAAAFVAVANVAAAAIAFVRPPQPDTSPTFNAIRALVGGPLALL